VRSILTLREDRELSIAAAALTPAEVARLVASKQFQVSRSLDAQFYELTSRGWIGQFPLSATSMIRVDPKVPISNVLWMLDVAHQFETFKLWEEHLTDVETLPELFSALAGIFGRLVCDRVRRGIFRDYVHVRRAMALVRGRIDVGASIVRAASSQQLVCEFEEFTPDIADNQILLFALDLMTRLHLESRDAAMLVQRARRTLLGAVSLRTVRGDECLNRRYHRLNEDYRPLHSLARLFIEHVGPGLSHGSHEALPFAIHMPTLFERFVARWLERASPPELEFIPKFSLRIESTHAVRLEVDLLCKSRATGQVLAVIDTKYKAPEKPSSDDLGQIALYSLQTGTKRAFLVYPSGQHGGFEARIGDVSIRSLTFDIGTPPRPDGDSFLRTLLGELRGTEAT
jgi:5-methylcytosine-specific restriction enzyme subunit McrC